jgi:putative transposase
VKSLRRSGAKVVTDERILGTDDFVERVLAETDRTTTGRLFSFRLQEKRVKHLIEERCKREGISLRELQMGSRRGAIPGIRSELVFELVREWGLPLAEIARQVGVSTSAISQIMRRGRANQSI